MGMSEATSDQSIKAVDAALDQLCELREILRPHGYTMKQIDIGIAVLPTIEVHVSIREDATLSGIDETAMTDMQKAVITALRQKRHVEPMLARHDMQFNTLKILLGVVPKVRLCLGWKEKDEENDANEATKPPLA